MEGAKMRVQLVAGAEADIATGDEVRKAVKGGTDSILNRLPSNRRGVRLRPIASANLPVAATGTFVLDLGAPQADTVWMVQEVIATAADDRTAPASAVAALYCGAPARQVSPTTIADTPPLGALVRPALALPAVFTFNGELWPVKDGEHLFVIVYSTVTAVAVVAAVATVMQLDSSAVSLDRVP